MKTKFLWFVVTGLSVAAVLVLVGQKLIGRAAASVGTGLSVTVKTIDVPNHLYGIRWQVYPPAANNNTYHFTLHCADCDNPTPKEWDRTIGKDTDIKRDGNFIEFNGSIHDPGIYQIGVSTKVGDQTYVWNAAQLDFSSQKICTHGEANFDPPSRGWCHFKISVKGQASSYTVTWSAVPGANAYFIYECTGEHGGCNNQVGGPIPGSQTTFTRENLKEGVYRLWIRTQATQERYSQIEGAVVGASETCEPSQRGVIPPPTNIKAVPSGRQVKVSWDPIPNCPDATYTVIAALRDGCTRQLGFRCSEEFSAGKNTSLTITPSGWGKVPIKICVRAQAGGFESDWEQACISSDGQNPDAFVADEQGNYQNASESGRDCGCKGTPFYKWIFHTQENVQSAICQATCTVSQALGGLVEWIVQRLIEVSGVSVEPGFALQLAGICWVSLFI